MTGWRTTVVCLGLIGFPWVVAWFVFYRDPHRTWWLSPAEREVVLRGRDIAPDAPGASVAELFR